LILTSTNQTINSLFTNKTTNPATTTRNSTNLKHQLCPLTHQMDSMHIKEDTKNSSNSSMDSMEDINKSNSCLSKHKKITTNTIPSFSMMILRIRLNSQDSIRTSKVTAQSRDKTLTQSVKLKKLVLT
jgi:hypothetical protein